MTVENDESRQRSVRVKKAKDNWLQQRADINPANKHNNVATEINSLIDKAHDADPKNEKFRKSAGI